MKEGVDKGVPFEARLRVIGWAHCRQSCYWANLAKCCRPNENYSPE